MSSGAGLQSRAIESRIKIKKRNVKPPVVGRFTQYIEVDEVPEVPTLQILKTETITEIAEAPKAQVPLKIEPKISKKKVTFTLPRYEVRLTKEHEKIVTALHSKAKKETPNDNNGVNNGELFGGFLEFARDLQPELSFRNIDFKRGKLSGEGTDKIKKEIGKSLKEATLRSFIKSLTEPESEVLSYISELSSEDKSYIKEQILRNL